MWNSASVFRILTFLSLLLAGHAGADPIPAESTVSVFAIGDVHGDFDDFVSILQHIGLTDKKNDWTGGKATLVQVGDLLDRGNEPRRVMDILMALEKEAVKEGGHVVSLLGNHEVMNIMGDLRYVTAENYASFADAKSKERSTSAYKDFLKWRHSHSALIAELPQPIELTEAEWMARHPLGFIEQREAFSPRGLYGKWLRERAALAEVDGVIFLHGGISPSLISMSLDSINSRIHDEISAFDSCRQYMVDQGLILPFFNLQEIVSVVQAQISAEAKGKVPANPELQTKTSEFLKFPDWLSVRTDGPLWFRGYDQWTEEEGSSQVEKILKSFKVDHLVTGHTVQKGGMIRPRFGGKVFLIDTGMLSSYYTGGRASALAIQGNAKFTAQYMDHQVVLLEPVKTSRQRKKLEDRVRVLNARWTPPNYALIRN
jgi:calcineurin-like phosphoesterase family protein